MALLTSTPSARFEESTATGSPALAPSATFDHLELYVGNARAFTQLLCSGLGMTCVGYLGPETGVRDRASYLLRQGAITLVVTAGLDPDSEIARHVLEHGDGVRTVAFAVEDVDYSYGQAVRRGAEPLFDPADQRDGAGAVRSATIAAYGTTLHSFVDRSGYAATFGPGFEADGLPSPSIGRPVGLEAIDHVVGNVEEGTLDKWAGWYAEVLGLTELRHFDADQISTEYSALRSTVMWNGGEVKLPLNEPAPGRRTSQIQEYLDTWGGPGVQHVAISTRDIVASVSELRSRGIRLLVPPPTYYEDARERCGDLDVPWADLERLGILVDVDGGGYLLQVFTETMSDRPTLFLEVIQREGATGFGEGNFKALFEAIEREQARRGNL